MCETRVTLKRRKKDSSLPSKKIKPLPGGCASPSLPHLFIFKMAFHSQLLMRSHAVCPSSHLSSRLSVTHKVKVVAMNYSPPLEPHSRSRSRFFCSFNWVSEDNNEDNISLIKQRAMVFKKLRWMKDMEHGMLQGRDEVKHYDSCVWHWVWTFEILFLLQEELQLVKCWVSTGLKAT